MDHLMSYIDSGHQTLVCEKRAVSHAKYGCLPWPLPVGVLVSLSADQGCRAIPHQRHRLAEPFAQVTVRGREFRPRRGVACGSPHTRRGRPRQPVRHCARPRRPTSRGQGDLRTGRQSSCRTIGTRTGRRLRGRGRSRRSCPPPDSLGA